MAVSARRLLGGMIASTLVIGLALAISDVGGASPNAGILPPVPKRAIPPELEQYVRASARCPGLDPLILMAIHDVESRRDERGGTSSAGAMGPMQFLPDTWAAYGADANGDGQVDAWNLDDALAGATSLLCRNGIANEATHDSAIWNYNHSWQYVGAVLVRVKALHQTLGF